MIHLVTLDFWNTLYVNTGTREWRFAVIQDRIYRYCSPICGAFAAKDISTSFFGTLNSFIKHEWRGNRWPQHERVIKECQNQFSDYLDMGQTEAVIGLIEELYASELRMRPIEGALSFVRFVAQQCKVAIISDTYVVPGRVIREVLAKDGVDGLFTRTYFSDETGLKKPTEEALRLAMRDAGSTPTHTVHIGDLDETDGELARRVGANYIIIGNNKEHASQHVCQDFESAKSVLRRLNSVLGEAP